MKRIISTGKKRLEAGSGMTGMIIRGMEEVLPEETEYGSDEPYWDWTELSEFMSTSDFIGHLRVIPFRIYIRRYILEKHGIPLPDPADAAAGKWPVSDEEFRNLALSDFAENGCIFKKTKQKSGIYFPYSGESMTEEELDALLSAEQGKSSDLLRLAFGLGMPYEVFSDLLRKACRTGGLNLWREKEFFAYLVFRFTDEKHFAGRQEAYAAIAKAFKNEKTAEKKELGAGYRTELIRSLADRMAFYADGENESIRAWLAAPQENMPDALRSLLTEYRKVLNAKGDYVRTAVKKAYDLWKSFRDVSAEDIRSYEEGGAADSYAQEDAAEEAAIREGSGTAAPAADQSGGGEGTPAADRSGGAGTCAAERNGSGAETGNIAAGTVQIRYAPGRAFFLPQGVTLHAKGSVFTFRENENGDFRVPADEKTALKIPVRSVLPARDPGVMAVTKASRFRSADGRFWGVGPSSSFKEKKSGKESYLEGNLEIVCPYGTSIAEGSMFIEQKSGAVYRSVRLSECPLTLTAVSDTEAVKDELKNGTFVTADGAAWNLPEGMTLGNKKIGFGKYAREQSKAAAGEAKENDGEQGVVVRYLYYSYAKDELTDDMSLDPEHIRLLREHIFRPETKFSASKIYGLEKKKKIDISRSDLLTLVFLSFASERQLGEIREENIDAPAKQWLAAFLQIADKVLAESGFGGVYRADPYDAMLSYLAAATDEPLNAFRNLWGIILHE